MTTEDDLAIAGLGVPPADDLDARNDTARQGCILHYSVTAGPGGILGYLHGSCCGPAAFFTPRRVVTGPKVPVFAG